MSLHLQLADGTWWTIGQSYEKYDGNDWSGTGRQTSLYRVNWEGERPWGEAPTTEPLIKPNLPKSDIPWRAVNTWVGTSIGLFAEGKPADLDLFICKDGATTLPAFAYSNYYGVKTLTAAQENNCHTTAYQNSGRRL